MDKTKIYFYWKSLKQKQLMTSFIQILGNRNALTRYLLVTNKVVDYFWGLSECNLEELILLDYKLGLYSWDYIDSNYTCIN